MMRVDLNCDAGESFGAYVLGDDELLLPEVTSVNIACGFHAGDHNVMADTVKLARDTNTAVGAHPGFQDLAGFGRRLIDTSEKDIYNSVVYQLGALEAFCKTQGIQLQHVKPHGALYNYAAVNAGTARAVAAAVQAAVPGSFLYALSGSALVTAGKKAGLNVVQEVFADRTYQPDGTLTSRKEANAVIVEKEQAAAQVMEMIQERTVTCVDGSKKDIQADSICIHGDGKQAAAFAKRLRELLEAEGVQVKAPGAPV
ncbi:LamB/YcsF family protein [Alkalicoccus daliensis]|uniref:LamB/YcsF family protein n=1 Tax=Alkalicoccus daliensis TaxID=745820 RepID=UPI000B8138A6|nr:5-oxoprolinase subunit PxpA [Alkalicoccus daliensis]